MKKTADSDSQTFRIYKVDDVSQKGKTNVAWEVVSQLKIGEAVDMPMTIRFRLIIRAKQEGVYIRTLKKNSKTVQIVRIAPRPYKKGT